MNAFSNNTKDAASIKKPEIRQKESEVVHEQDIENSGASAKCACGGGCNRCNTNYGHVTPKNNALPAPVRGAMEQMSGMDLSSVNVHYNSREPSRLGANAYAKSNDIHLAPGHENELPHEAWHVVQQMQGRVQATGTRDGIPTNIDQTMESEADTMGRKSAAYSHQSSTLQIHANKIPPQRLQPGIAQLSPAKIVTVEVYPNTGEVVITLEGGKKYTYPINTTELVNPEPIDNSITPEYVSGTKIPAYHLAESSTDHHREKQKYKYGWAFNLVQNQPSMKEFPPGNYSVIFYLKGADGSGSGKGEGDGAGDKTGEGETTEKKIHLRRVAMAKKKSKPPKLPNSSMTMETPVLMASR